MRPLAFLLEKKTDKYYAGYSVLALLQQQEESDAPTGTKNDKVSSAIKDEKFD
jgi:hypothetical protein